MSAFLLRRVGQSAVLLVLVTAIAFGLMRLAPGATVTAEVVDGDLRLRVRA